LEFPGHPKRLESARLSGCQRQFGPNAMAFDHANPSTAAEIQISTGHPWVEIPNAIPLGKRKSLGGQNQESSVQT